MIPALIWSNTVFYLLIPAPPNATSVSASMSGTLQFNLYTKLDNAITVTAAAVGTWGGVDGGYAKVKITHGGDSSLKPGPAVVYVIDSGSLTVTFQ